MFKTPNQINPLRSIIGILEEYLGLLYDEVCDVLSEAEGTQM